MHYQGDGTKSTRVGGLVSIVGIVLVTAFLFGTISMFFAFSNVDTNTSTTGIKPLNLLDCTADKNECQSLNGTTYMPFVFITGDPATNPQYVVPEFYAYQEFADGTTSTNFYSAVPCTQIYDALYGSSDNYPESLWLEVISADWLCPNIPVGQSYTLSNDPFLSLFGSNFNFVVNLCQYAATTSAADKALCETDEQTILDYLFDIQVVYKSVH